MGNCKDCVHCKPCKYVKDYKWEEFYICNLFSPEEDGWCMYLEDAEREGCEEWRKEH